MNYSSLAVQAAAQLGGTARKSLLDMRIEEVESEIRVQKVKARREHYALLEETAREVKCLTQSHKALASLVKALLDERKDNV